MAMPFSLALSACSRRHNNGPVAALRARIPQVSSGAAATAAGPAPALLHPHLQPMKLPVRLHVRRVTASLPPSEPSRRRSRPPMWALGRSQVGESERAVSLQRMHPANVHPTTIKL